MHSEDTIAAIATAQGESGISIIRISGPDAIAVADRVCLDRNRKRRIKSFAPNTIHLGYAADADGGILDEVLVSVFKAPSSYTAEDTVEINTHGGIYVTHRVLDAVLAAGCRLAEPGEFTKRAFLAGRIDLAEAEAVMDVISSESEFARKAAVSALTGTLSGKVRDMRERILYETAFIESALDDPENYDLDGYPEKLKEKTLALISEMSGLLSRASDGAVLKEGIRTAIIGKPNAGKSSLLNALSGEDRAIVTEIAGTTRDTLEEKVRIGECVLRLIDTAGIRNTEDVVEKIGVSRARSAAAEADLLLAVFDASKELAGEDEEIASLVRKAAARGKRAAAVLNKSDLPARIREEEITALIQGVPEGCGAEGESEAVSPAVPPVSVPVLTLSLAEPFTGLEELKSEILSLFGAGELMRSREALLVNRRHAEAMAEARAALEQVLAGIDSGVSEEFYAGDLMAAYAALGRIIGEQVDDDLAEEIFSRFCLGK